MWRVMGSWMSILDKRVSKRMNLLLLCHYRQSGCIFESNRGLKEEGMCGEVVVVRIKFRVVEPVLCEWW